MTPETKTLECGCIIGQYRCEAEYVAGKLEARSEMIRVTINTAKPKMRRGTLYSVFSRGEAPAWYPTA